MEESKTPVIVRALCGLITLYQFQSPVWGRHCRFYPSCSDYMRQSLLTRGLWNGLQQGTLRILKCHPWNPGGVDLVRRHGE